MATEILKPTSSTASDSWTDEAQAYNGESGGEDTTYAYADDGTSDPSIVFDTWATPAQSHTQRTLFIRRAGTGTWDDDVWGISYSIDAGGGWTVIESGNQTVAKGNTTGVDISTALDLPTYLQVKILWVRTKGGDGGRSEVWDVWLEGEYTEVSAREISKSESVSAADSLMPALGAEAVAEAESVGASDSPTASLGAQVIAEAEGISISDSPSASFPTEELEIAKSESVSAGDSLSSLLDSLEASLSESVGASDDGSGIPEMEVDLISYRGITVV